MKGESFFVFQGEKNIMQVAEFEVNGKNIAVYWKGKEHRYVFSLNYGEKYIEMSKAKGEAVIQFLKEVFD